MTEYEVASIIEWAERAAVLETEVKQLKAELETKTKELKADQTKIMSKLDELLELRHKGVGVFWLASSLLGTGIIGAVMTFIHWIRG